VAIKNNSGLKASLSKVEEEKALISSAFEIDKTSVYYSYDENNLAINNFPIRVFGIAQDFKFPTFYFADKKVKKAQANLEQANYNITKNQLEKAVTTHFYQLNYAKNKAKTYQYLDSLYQDFAKKSERRFQLGETNYLEMITAKSKQKQLQTLYKQTLQEVELAKEQLKSVVQIDAIDIVDVPLTKLALQQNATNQNLGLDYFSKANDVQNALFKKEQQTLLPDISLEYFQGTNNQLNTFLRGYQIGLKIPLFFGGNASKIKASKIAKNTIFEKEKEYKTGLESNYKGLLAKLNQFEEAINYYESEGKKLKEEIIKTANRNFAEGEIDFFQYIQSLETAKDIELSYLDNLNGYNQTVISINYLILNTF
ncbi:MAG: TolC family protein, partial [Polaribacter sp.]|nr:TolC family protein [Polaribacter sp.]